MSPRLNAAQKEAQNWEQWQRMSSFEQELRAQGKQFIAGVDEAGRGPLAGPVAAAAVILPPDAYLPGLNDSKQLSEKSRLELEQQIKEQALAWACAIVNHRVIDRINILEATKLAMEKALAKLEQRPDFLLIDGTIRLPIETEQEALIKGDGRSVSIAAASILAKCTRDRMMLQMDRRFPEYQFAKHKGYPTPLHKQLLREYGPSPIHRRSFKY